MCGVVGYIGKKLVDKTVVDMLKNLEYRGYDSAGVSYIKDNKIKVVKTAGKIENLEKKIVKENGGLVGCPKDAAKNVLDIADYVATHNGGDGAVRDFIEWLVE